MRRTRTSVDERGQMLLATGMILLLALLMMAFHSTKVASLGEPYDGSEDAVLMTAPEVQAAWSPLLENRSSALVAAGADRAEACGAAAESVRADLMRHGEHRGVEIILVDLNAIHSEGDCVVKAKAGIADRHARLEIDLLATFALV